MSDDDIVDAVLVDDDVPEWVAFIASATTRDELRGVWNRFAGQIDTPGRARLSQAMTDRAEEIDADTSVSGDGVGETNDSTEVRSAEPDVAPSPDTTDGNEKATRAKLARLSINLNALGIREPQECRDYIGAVIGRVIASRKELTNSEADVAIARSFADIQADKQAVS